MKTIHQTEHTPGPWSSSGMPEDGWVMAHHGFKRIRVACVFESNPAFTDAPDRDACIANLHLIAAAPDLLAALQAIVNNPDMADGQEPWRLIVAARAAIAQAKGEA